MDIEQIKRAANWDALASSLSGRDCEVQFVTPDKPGWILGLHFKMRGKSIIQVSPERVDDEDFLRVFLHETAHARLHYDDMHDWQSLAQKVQNTWRLAALPASAPSAKRNRDEEEAEALTAQWLEYCAGSSSLTSKAVDLIVWAALAKLGFK